MINKTRINPLLLAFVLLFVASKSYAQQHIPQSKAEKGIINYLKQMKHWQKQKKEYSSDSVYAVNKRLIQLMSDIGYEGYTLSADFKNLKAAGMQIHTSDDQMCRTFCWEVISYGSSHYYNYMITYYQSATRSMSFTNKDGTSLTDIYTVHTYDSNTIYLMHEENRYDIKNRMSRYVAHVLKNGYLTITTFFYNNADSQTFAGYTYNLSSFSAKEQKIPQVRLSENKQEFFVPIINNGGIFSGNELVYRFDGRKFVYDTYTKKKN